MKTRTTKVSINTQIIVHSTTDFVFFSHFGQLYFCYLYDTIFHLKKESMFMKRMVGQFLYTMVRNKNQEIKFKQTLFPVHRHHHQSFFNRLIVLAYHWTPMAFLQCKTTIKFICQEFPLRSKWEKSLYLKEL